MTDLLTRKQAAKLIMNQYTKKMGVSVERVRQMIKSGELPGEKVGRDWIIKKSDVLALGDRPPGRPWHKRKPTT